MTARLNFAQTRSYWRDGFLFPLTVLSLEESKRYRAGADRLELQMGGRPRTVELRQMHLHFPWAYELATHPRILDMVEDLLGPNLLVWATELFTKHPQDANISIGWHRDRKYNGFDSESSVTAWVALSPSHVENGCLRIVPEGQDIDNDGCRQSAVNIVLQPGQMSLHNADVLHGSTANRSNEKRVGFAIRYVTPDACEFSQASDSTLVLARGIEGDLIRLAAPPQGDDEQIALRCMKESAAEHLEQILQNLKQPTGARG